MTNRDAKTGQFKAGSSGNPTGRPLASENVKTLLTRLMGEKHLVKADGGKKTLTTLELLTETILKCGLKKGHLYTDLYDTLLQHVQPEQQPGQKCGFLVVPEPISHEEWVKEAEKLRLKLAEHHAREEEEYRLEEEDN